MHFVPLTFLGQTVNIPDLNLKNAMVTTICADFNNDNVLDGDVDANNDGVVQLTEAQAVKRLVFAQTSELEFVISNLTGIESFTNLKKLNFGWCIFENITSADFTSLTQLDYLEFNHADSNVLQTINVSNLIFLNELRVMNIRPIDVDIPNPKVIVNLEGSINLETLSIYNSFVIIDYIQIPNLKALDCSYLEGGEPDVFDFSSLLYLEDLNISENLIKVLIIKNGSVLNSLNLSDLYPSEGQVVYICIDDNEEDLVIESLGTQNLYPIYTSYCFNYPGGLYNSVSGNLKYDFNNNGCNSGDINTTQMKMKMVDGDDVSYTFTNDSGAYQLYNVRSSVVVNPVLENNNFTFSPASYNYTYDTYGNAEIADFCFNSVGNNPDLSITFLPYYKPIIGGLHRICLSYKNLGNQIQSGTISLTKYTDGINLTSSSIPPNTSVSNTISWNFANLSPFETRTILLEYYVNSPTNVPPVNIGDFYHFKATITSPEGDDNLVNNSYDLYQEVVSGCPDQEIVQARRAQNSISSSDEYIDYVIFFKNTGEENVNKVVIKDILPSTLDASSLRIEASSHNFWSKLSSNNKLEFFFDNISLQPSIINPAASRGFIAFRVKPSNTASEGTVIENSAAIYFDNNFMATTSVESTTISSLKTKGFDSNNLFSIYPNPASQKLNIETKPNIKVESISIYNPLGQLVKTISYEINPILSIDISDLKTGAYFMEITTNEGKAIKKFVKM
jgi:uncharacterized repeat protein (TIGR01451 family)